MADFAGLVSQTAVVLDPHIFGLLWSMGDTDTLRELARRVDLPKEFHRQASRHESIQVRNAYAENPFADIALLGEMASSGTDDALVHTLTRNPRTPEQALIALLSKGDRELAMSALRREGASVHFRAAAAALLAHTSDPTALTATRQLAGILGSDPAIHVAALRAAPHAALGFVGAALHACPGDPEVNSAFINWVELHFPSILREDYKDLQKLISNFGEHPLTNTNQRRWAVGKLAAWRDRVGTEALIARETNDIQHLASTPSSVALALEYIEHLAVRIPHNNLAPYVAIASRTLLVCDVTTVNRSVLHLRKMYGPLVDAAIRLLEQGGELAPLHLLLQRVGVNHLDALENPWWALEGLEAPAAKIAALRFTQQDPERTLNTLRPLEDLLRCGSRYTEAALQAFHPLGVGSPTWRTAAVLSTSWQGTLDELLAAARSL